MNPNKECHDLYTYLELHGTAFWNAMATMLTCMAQLKELNLDV